MKLPPTPPHIVLALTCVSLLSTTPADVIVDSSFSAEINPAGYVKAIAVESDGKVVIGGEFSSVNGSSAVGVARLSTDGTLDQGFTTGSGPDGAVEAIAINAAGELVIGGSFNSFDGVASRHVAKLLTGGSFDTTFTSGTSSRVTCVAFGPDGGIVAGGSFRKVNGQLSPYVCRLDDFGTPDPAFKAALEVSFAIEAGVEAIAVQPDGKMVVGGVFNTSRGSEKLVRLNADGTLDFTFSQDHGPILYPKAIVPLSNGQFLVAGLADANDTGFVRRLNSDGSIDSTFQAPVFDGYVNAVAIGTDGSVVVGGSFSAAGEVGSAGLIRLLPDGEVDREWTVGTDGPVHALAIDPSGRILVGGAFTKIGETARSGIARLKEASLQLQAAAPSPEGAFVLQLQAVAGKTYVVESSSDLTTWETFSTNTATNAGLEVSDAGATSIPRRFFRARLLE